MEIEKRCKHGLMEDSCSFCDSRGHSVNKKREPIARIEKTIHGSICLTSEKIKNYAIIHSRGGRNHGNFQSLNENTVLVHIDGYPFLWIIEKIIELAPNVEIIQVIPTMRRKFLQSHLELCEKHHNVKIIVGHWKPECAWKDNENRSPFYKAQALFFMNLSDEQKRLFDELIALKFDAALITARYFCLNGKDFIPQRLVAKEFGYKEDEGLVSRRVNAIIKYVDQTFNAGKEATLMAGNIKRRVSRIRSFFNQADFLSEISKKSVEMAKKIGLEKLPLDFPLSRFDDLEAVVLANRDGRLKKLENEYPKWYWVIVHRFGIIDGQYRTLEAVGLLLDISRERVRQLEEKTFKILGISIE
ncbi:MAG: sigma factor-like helix-turn-helix DNA-binding protein [Patescibacteria group bacterium]